MAGATSTRVKPDIAQFHQSNPPQALERDPIERSGPAKENVKHAPQQRMELLARLRGPRADSSAALTTKSPGVAPDGTDKIQADTAATREPTG